MTKREMLLEALASTITDVKRVTAGLSNDAALWRANAESLTAVEVVRQMIRSEALLQNAILSLGVEHADRQLVGAEPPPPASDVGNVLAELVMRFTEERRHTLMMLQDLAPGQWQQAPAPGQSGAKTLRFLLQDIVAADIKATGELVEIRRSYLHDLAQGRLGQEIAASSTSSKP